MGSRANLEHLEVFVSPGGSACGTGSKRRPFGTLEQARDSIRALRARSRLPTHGITVWVRSGDYVRNSSFELTAEDSGTAKSPIAYRSHGPKPAKLIGGRVIGGFRRIQDPRLLARLSPEAQQHVRVADLCANGITDLGSLASRGFNRPLVPAHMELFFNDEPMTLARWPNAGEFSQIHGFAVGQADEWNATLGKLEDGFVYAGDRPSRWAPSEDIWVHGYWTYDWANSYEHVRLLDLQRRLVQTDPPYGNYGFRPGQRFFFLNVLEELDQPGEYYVDRTTGLLYFWPPTPLAAGRAVASELRTPIVCLVGAEYVTLQGFVMECARGHGVQIDGGSHVTIAGCTIRNLGNCGVMVNNGHHHTVAGCDMYNTGDGGISVAGGDRPTLTPADHVVHNNHVHHFARWSRCYQGAVNASGCGHRIAHNLIHDGPHTAILYWGNEILIELNEIYSMCTETGDVGALYTGRDWTYRGNVIRHNFIHHTGGVGMGSMAVYMDDCVSGHLIHGNVFWHVCRAAFLGGGRDHIVSNNIFVDCEPAVWLDGRGVDKHPVWRNMVGQTMKKSLEAMRPDEPPYRTRYPELATLRNYYTAGDGVPGENNRVLRNVCVRGHWLQVEWNAKSEWITVTDNLVDRDPLFVAPEWGRFGLRSSSPAWRLGFERIPIDRIGLVKDTYRSALPSRVLSRLTVEPQPSRSGRTNVRLHLWNLGKRPERGSMDIKATSVHPAGIVAQHSVAFRIGAGKRVSLTVPMHVPAGPIALEAASTTPGVRPARLHLTPAGA